MKMTKKILDWALAVIVTFLLVVFGYTHWMKIQKEKPLCLRCNVVMIDIDILRADALPCYGYKKNTAHNICALAQRSRLFINNFTQSNWTLPAMFSTITSLYPSQHGVTASMRDALNPKVQTVAQIFKNAGYKTYYFGSLGSSTINDTNGGTKGYDLVKNVKTDEWADIVLNLSGSHRPFFIHFYTNSLHMPYVLENPSQITELAPRPAGFPITKNDFSLLLGKYLLDNRTKLFTPEAIKRRPDLFNGRDTSSLVEYYWSLYKSTEPDFINSEGWRVVYELYVKTIKEGGVGAGKYARLLYDSTLLLLDKNISPLLALWSASALRDNTILVLYSDHGEEFNDHGQYGHMGNLYNEIIKTPLIIYVPGVSPKKIGSLSQNIDVFPTLVDLVGISGSPDAQGVSLFPKNNTSRQPGGNLAISQSGTNKVAISDGVWKIINAVGGKSLDNAELYNLESDPEEKYNVLTLRPGVGIILMNELFKRVPARYPEMLPTTNNNK